MEESESENNSLIVPTNFQKRYILGEKIGNGAFGIVH